MRAVPSAEPNAAFHRPPGASACGSKLDDHQREHGAGGEREGEAAAAR